MFDRFGKIGARTERKGPATEEQPFTGGGYQTLEGPKALMGVAVGGQFNVEAALRRHGAIPPTRDRHNDADSIGCRGLQALAPFFVRSYCEQAA